jgi:hypothetical protein
MYFLNQDITLLPSQFIRTCLSLNSFIIYISLYDILKSYTSIFSFICYGFFERGITTKLCCNPHLKHIWATLLLYFFPIYINASFSVILLSPFPIGEYASITICFYLQYSINYFCHNNGWTSNWFTAGL